MSAAAKDSANPFFKSKYADLASVWEAIRKPLSSNGLALVQFPRSNDAGVEVETLLIHSSGEWVAETLHLPVSKHDAQGVGSAITYARRYGLQSVAGVAPDDDDGNAAAASPARQAAKPIKQAEPTPARNGAKPMTADEFSRSLTDRIREKEGELIAAGKCYPKQLQETIEQAWSDAALPDHPSKWSLAQRPVGSGLCKSLIADFESKPAPENLDSDPVYDDAAIA
jgi:hypothetical protein